jgi:hypothetical protein
MSLWQRIVAAHKSHTIYIARVKLFLGMVFTAIQQVGVSDVAALLTPKPEYQLAIKIFFAYCAADGFITEWARKYKANDLDVGNNS